MSTSPALVHRRTLTPGGRPAPTPNTFGSSPTNSNGFASIVIGIPSAAVVGQFAVIVACTYQNSGSPSLGAISGWTQVLLQTAPGAISGQNVTLSIYTKRLLAGDPGTNVTIPVGGPGATFESNSATIGTYSGTSGINVVGAHFNAGFASSVPSASVTTTAPNCLVSEAWMAQGSFSGLPATIRIPGSIFTNLALCDQVQAAAGATPSQTATQSSTNVGAVATYALAP